MINWSLKCFIKLKKWSERRKNNNIREKKSQVRRKLTKSNFPSIYNLQRTSSRNKQNPRLMQILGNSDLFRKNLDSNYHPTQKNKQTNKTKLSEIKKNYTCFKACQFVFMEAHQNWKCLLERETKCLILFDWF